MISGGGRSHGSLAIADGLLRCPKTLPQIKKHQSSSDPEIMPRAWPAELAVVVSYTNSLAFPPWLLSPVEERRGEAAIRGRGGRVGLLVFLGF